MIDRDLPFGPSIGAVRPSLAKKQRSASPTKAQQTPMMYSQGDFDDAMIGMSSRGNDVSVWSYCIVCCDLTAIQAPKVFLQEYKLSRSNTLQAVLNARCSKDFHMCSECAEELETPLRCITCFHVPVYCNPCLLRAHHQSPFHDIEIRTKDDFWARTTLFQQKFVLPVHFGGCSTPQDPDYTEMTIITSSRICQMTVQWCTCTEDDRADQLLSIRLFPATFTSPKTAFTFEGLDQFLTEHTICKTTAYSFYEKLRHLTHALDPKSLKV
jgi:hypothetical protein